jgi:hypothetical protein
LADQLAQAKAKKEPPKPARPAAPPATETSAAEYFNDVESAGSVARPPASEQTTVQLRLSAAIAASFGEPNANKANNGSRKLAPGSVRIRKPPSVDQSEQKKLADAIAASLSKPEEEVREDEPTPPAAVAPAEAEPSAAAPAASDFPSLAVLAGKKQVETSQRLRGAWAQSEPAPTSWTCSVCTFENVIELAACSMCSSTKSGRKFATPEPLASTSGNKKKNKKQVLIAFG